MTAEGWDGKSLRQHVEAAAAGAEEARSLAESAHDEVATLRAELAELAAKCKCCNPSLDGGQG